MKKALFTGAVITLLCVPSVAFAKGTAGIKFEGNTNVNVGDEFTVNMVIDNVNDTEEGIVGLGGYITYDSDVLELVETSQGDTYEVLINRNNNKIVGIDYTMANGIKDRTNVFTLKFRSKAAGNTNITLTDGELEDRYSSVDFNVDGLYVTSSEKVEEIPVIENKRIEENTKILVENEENYETQISVEPTNVENKDKATTKKIVKNTKKAAKKATKKKKNFLEIIKSFFINIIKM